MRSCGSWFPKNNSGAARLDVAYRTLDHGFDSRVAQLISPTSE